MSAQKIALVTGANRGLGLETCRQLAALGLHPVLTSRNPDEGRAAAGTLQQEGMEVEFHPLDVSGPGSISALINTLATRHGRIDVLINNAGVAGDKAFNTVDVDLDRIAGIFDVNLFGAWRMCQAVVPIMKQHGYGRIVNVSSRLGALHTMKGGSPGYGISKAALNALTIKLGDELRDTGILVNAVSPGWVRTRMGGDAAPRNVEEGARSIVWAATLPNNGPTGGFFGDGEPIPW